MCIFSILRDMTVDENPLTYSLRVCICILRLEPQGNSTSNKEMHVADSACRWLSSYKIDSKRAVYNYLGNCG